MSDYKHRPNSGSLFAHDRKGNDRAPTMKGTALVDGFEYKVSAWERTSSGGKQWLSLAFERKEAQAAAQQQPQEREPEQEPAPFNDEIPF